MIDEVAVLKRAQFSYCMSVGMLVMFRASDDLC